MKSVFASVAAALLLASSSVAQLMVNTPLSVVVCQPALLSWTAGTPPYFLSILPGNSPGAAALLNFPSQTTLSLTWIANFSVGTTLGLNLRDNTGSLVQSAPFTIQSGSDLSCLTASGSSSSSSGAAGSTPPTSAPASTPSTPATTPVTTPPATTPTTPAATTPKPTTSGSSVTPKPSTTPSSAMSAQNLNIGLAGVLGAALVALMV